MYYHSAGPVFDSIFQLISKSLKSAQKLQNFSLDGKHLKYTLPNPHIGREAPKLYAGVRYLAKVKSSIITS